MISKPLEQLLKENNYKFIASNKIFYIKTKGLPPVMLTIAAVLVGSFLLTVFLFQQVLEIKLISLGFALITVPFFYQKWKAMEAFSLFYEKEQYLLKRFFTQPEIISVEQYDSIQVHKRTLHADASPFQKDTKEYIYDISLLLKDGKKYFLMQLKGREDPAELIKELATHLEIRS